MGLDFLEFLGNEEENTTEQIKHSCGVSGDIIEELTVKIDETDLHVVGSEETDKFQKNKVLRPRRTKDMRDSL